MQTALYTASTGMNVASTDIDVKANNIANIRTHGFKKFRVETADLSYSTLRRAGIREAMGMDERPVGIHIGRGARVISAYRILTQGNIETTGNPLDIAIMAGSGYFAINLPNGRIGYTRHGVFHKNPNGDLATSEGYTLVDGINIPNNINVNTISISTDGQVTAPDPVNAAITIDLGNIALYNFANEQGLEPESSNFLVETVASGPATAQVPGENGTGKLQQRAREESNVDPATELTSLIMAQRAYELNSKVIKIADEAMKSVTDIKP